MRPTDLLTLRVTIENIEPAIWRRVQVRAGTALADLHSVLQIAFGWTNSHLHSFEFQAGKYANADAAAGELEDLNIGDEKGKKLVAVLSPGEFAFSYLYDWGDSWRHRIEIELIGRPRKGWRYPLCCGGERACPPEDVGGTTGYADFLAALRDPVDDDHISSLIWAGGVFDPEGFDVNAVNRDLAKLRR